MGLWNFHEAEGMKISDETGRNHAEAFGRAKPIPSAFGETWLLDGEGSYFRIANPTKELRDLSIFTIEALVFILDINSRARAEAVVSWGDVGYPETQNRGLALWAWRVPGDEYEDRTRFSFAMEGSHSKFSTPMLAKRWLYVAGIYDGRNLSLRVNNEEWLSGELPGIRPSLFGDLIFGGHSAAGDVSAGMTGLFRSIRISNIARAKEESDAIANQLFRL